MKKLLSFIIILAFQANAQDAYKIIKRADEHLRGASQKAEMSIEVKRPKWSRTTDLPLAASERCSWPVPRGGLIKGPVHTPACTLEDKLPTCGRTYVHTYVRKDLAGRSTKP